VVLERVAPPWTRRRELLRRLAFRKPADPVLRRWHRWAFAQDAVYFVQIGANDGVRGDPLWMHINHQPGWRGLMVEPVPATFAQLREQRADPKFQLVQAAITDRDGTVAITTFGDDDQDRSLLATIEHRVADRYDGLARDTIEVPAMTFATLTRDVADIDVLHVDAEGHDATILAQVDFTAWTMRAVLFEHAHLLPDERASTMARLRANGYRMWSTHNDTLCLR